MNAAAFALLGRSVVAVRMINMDLLYLWVLYLVTRFFSNRFANSRPLIPLAVLLVAASIGLTIAEPSWPGFAMSMAALLMYLRVDVWRTEPLFACRYRHLYRTSHVVADKFRRNRGSGAAVDLLTQWWCRGKARWNRRHLKSDVQTTVGFRAPPARLLDRH